MKDIYIGSLFSDSYLEHHGVLGMKWGVRKVKKSDKKRKTGGKKKTKLFDNKRKVRNRRIRSNAIQYIGTALAVGMYAYAASRVSSKTYSIGRIKVNRTLNSSVPNHGHLKDMSMDDLKKLDLW